jgi:ClpP class serine protease
MNSWLITQDALARIKNVLKNPVVPTSEQSAEFTASFSDGEYPGARIMDKIDNTAQINISGVLSKEPSWMLRYFGGGNTAYSEIISAINEAERDPNIKNVVFNIDSPGGETRGLTAAMDAIDAMTMPTKAVVSGMAASAAYGLASQTDKIVARDRGAMFGSIGVKATVWVDEHVVEITSSNAPNKAPDVTTDEGKKIVQSQLDQIEAIFIEDIASGRGVSIDKVKSDFGQGGVFLAKDALNHGMIDELDTKQRTQQPGATTTTQEAKTMNLQELKTQHPETYALAVAEGVAQEKDRVSAHLTMADASGDFKTAVEAIEKGDELTNSYIAKYTAAGMKNGQIGARQADTNTADTALAGAAKTGSDLSAEASEKAFWAGLTGE